MSRPVLPEPGHKFRLGEKRRLREQIPAAIEEEKRKIEELHKRLPHIPWKTDAHDEWVGKNKLPRNPDTGTYQIICPYCLNRYDVSMLEFRARVVSDSSGNVDAQSSFDYEMDEKHADHWREMGAQVNSNLPHCLDMDPASGEITAISFVNKNNIAGEWIEYNEDSRAKIARQRVAFLRDKYGNKTTKRICPYCHTELPEKIGFLPNYVFSLMGNSACGKSVYRMRLIRSLTSGILHGYSGWVRNDENSDLAYRLTTIARDTFTYREEGGQARRMSEATDVGYVRPVVLEMLNPNTDDDFYLTLFDFPGEAVWNTNNEAFVNLAQRNFDNTCGWLFLFASDSLPFVNTSLADQAQVDMQGQLELCAAPDVILNQFIDVYYSGLNFSRPVAYVLSKSDMIKQVRDKPLVSGKLKGNISFLDAAPEHIGFDLEDAIICNEAVRSMLSGSEMLLSNADLFTNNDCAWFAMSATGVFVGRDGIIPRGATSIGVRDLQPLEWLLYRWEHLDDGFGNIRDEIRECQSWINKALRYSAENLA